MMNQIANMDFTSALSGKPKTMNSNQNIENAKEAAQEFESFFLTQMLESMYTGVEPDPVFGGGQSEKIFRSFMLDEYGKMMAQNGGIGIADDIMDMMLQQQEVNNNGDKQQWKQ